MYSLKRDKKKHMSRNKPQTDAMRAAAFLKAQFENIFKYV